MGFEIVRREDCEQPSKGDRQSTFVRLEKELVAQAKMCQRNADHFKATGDVGSANKFQQMLEHTKKDLDALRSAFKRGDRAPRFFYEVRAFSRVVCNPELTDTELELAVVKGINFGVAKDADVFCKYVYIAFKSLMVGYFSTEISVRIEFPYPKETPFRDRTAVVKANAANPEFNFKVIIPGNTKDKSFQVFSRISF